MTSKKKALKGIKSLEKKIKEHREKQEKVNSPELLGYWKKEISKFEKEIKKKKVKEIEKKRKRCIRLS
ncbi:MAG: hypothetical protein ABH821_00775 [archaeon]